MEKFEYDPIDLEESSFRLLRLLKGDDLHVECELFEAWLHGDSAFEFEALSYTWGSPYTCETITVNGKELAVTENLYLALRNLRYQNMDRILWVDAVCIDQRNNHERGHQVQQMGSIYSQADRVIFWLGLSTEPIDILMRSLKQQGRENYDRQNPTNRNMLANGFFAQPSTSEANSESVEKRYGGSQKHIEQQREGLRDLLTRPWFQRVWILQEVANARRAIVCCGSNEINARIFAHASQRFDFTPSSHTQAVLDIMPGPSGESSWWSQKRNLYTLLLKFKESRASDPRDKIYALLGISSDGKRAHGLRADYTKTTEEVIHDITSYLFNIDQSPYQVMSEFLNNFHALNTSSLVKGVQSTEVREIASFLQERGDLTSITEEVLQAAAANTRYGVEMVEFFIDRQDFTLKDSILQSAARNEGCGLQVLEFLCESHRPGVSSKRKQELDVVSKGTIEAAIANKRQGNKMLDFFLSHLEDKVSTELVLELASSNMDTALDIVQRLIEYRGDRVIMAAAGGAMNMMALVVEEYQRRKWQIPTEAFKVAAGNTMYGPEVTQLLLEQEHRDKITTNVLEAALKNRKCGDKILALHLQQKEVRSIPITQSLFLAALGAFCEHLILPLAIEQRRRRVTTVETPQEEECAVYRELYGECRFATVNKMEALARTYQEQGRLEEAAKLWRQVNDQKKVHFGMHQAHTRANMTELASISVEQGLLEAAEDLLVQVIAHEEEIVRFNGNLISGYTADTPVGSVKETLLRGREMLSLIREQKAARDLTAAAARDLTAARLSSWRRVVLRFRRFRHQSHPEVHA
ncbi:hypothetical protein N0V83_009035 [Neocucurbitaria cava]|uniref:Heterokaryon incompatibility domain-containing protein n=1 Tax=Neocucurbitaria cava TaxID=798079 RepID=A0A9W9CIQ3_9PLEO|nr:hypothetical protein N0V83_009035 [Neocucurbitaria cava]